MQEIDRKQREDHELLVTENPCNFNVPLDACCQVSPLLVGIKS